MTMSFNPRTREGCDIDIACVRLSIRSFNPRTREGCDLRPVTWPMSDTPFQSTHPRGVRLPGLKLTFGHVLVSIHAPARGATTEVSHGGCGIRVSIHAPARGATRFRATTLTHNHVSIHAPARGATVRLLCQIFRGLQDVILRTVSYAK